MGPSYKRFPPPTGHLLIPTRTRRSALAGLSMYAPTKWTGVLIQRAAWLATWIGGPALLPIKSKSSGVPFVDGPTWDSLTAEWKQIGPFEDIAVYRPPDLKRVGLAVLLLNHGKPVAFVKLRTLEDSGLLVNEETALNLIAGFDPDTFVVSRPVSSGRVAEWHYLATEPLSGRLHRAPRRPPIESIVDEIQQGLSGLPKDPDTPDHWLPIHGDFSPWNLRRVPGIGLTLLDWEGARWAPPGSDLVMYRSTAAAVGKSSNGLSSIGGESLEEARAFWREYWRFRIGHLPAGAPYPKALAGQVLRVLDSVENSPA